jgi:signal transduction histidine kinase/CheY-like chemotaxis protein
MDVALQEGRVMSETREGVEPRELVEWQDRGQTREADGLAEKAAKRGRRGLASRLTWAFVSIAVGLLLIMGLVLTFVSYNAQVEQIVVRQQKTADGAALLTSEYLTRARDTLWIHGQTASGYGLLLRPLETQQSELNAILTGYGDMFQRVILVDDEGAEQAKVSLYETYGLEDLGSQEGSPAFQQALEGQVFVDAETRMLSGATFPAVMMAAPIRARAGSVRRGVLMADVSVEGMWNAVAQVRVGETGYAYIVDRATGELIAHSDPDRSEELRGMSLTEVSIVQRITAGVQDIQHQYQGLVGEQVIGAASGLPGTNWTLVVELPIREGLASVRQMLYLLVVLIVLGAVVAGSLGLLIPQRIVQPVRTLQRGAQEIGAGHLDHVIQVGTGDEIQDLAEAFNQMATNLKASQTELEQWGRELETKVEARTRELADASSKMQRRAIQLEASAEVARAIASVRDLDVLLGQVTQFISERFGWYHVGVFLLDRADEYAVLQAASSEGGQRMLARGHRLKVGERGIVGYVTGAGQPRIALDVGQDAVYFDNPDLPRTRSEMALPLAVGGRVIGALDVQSTEPAAYDDEDVALLRILADQVAIAIENVRLFERTQQSLQEVEAIHRQYIEREWTREAAERRDLVYEYRRSGVPPLDDAWPPELSEALSGGEVVAARAEDPSWGDGHAKAALAAPIKYRDQIIGVLDLQETAEARRWTEDEITLVQAISDQVGLALENARLFADTQRRAEELAAINRIGLSVNSDLDLTGVLNALYQELGRILDVESFYVALYDANRGMLEFPLLMSKEGPIKLEPQHIDESPGVTGHVLQSRQALYLPDLQAVPEDAPYHVVAVDEEPTRSYIGVPLISRDQVIGVLSVQSSQPGAYSEEDVELLTTVATQASTAIENARAYERLTETAEELREIDRFKTQFLANMSHELRTPLNSIIGFSRVMLKGIDGPLTESQEADLSSIYNSGQHLLALINSILDMSKIEAGKMELSFEEVWLPDILSAVLGTTNALVKDKPVELHSEIPEDLPTVWADAQRVRQVLLNLMSNAAKFTEEGYISIRAEAGDEFVTIIVKDTGAGIEPEAQSRLFIPFQQVDGSTTRRAGGTGLGLAISRSFVEMLGGEIWVESEPGEGATFGFTLPIYQVLQQKQDGAAEFQLDPDRKAILAIDDDPGVITLLKRYLESDGYQVIGVTEALHAVPAAQRLASDLTAITLDVVMPNTDGWQILRTLRQDPQTREIPIVLCSIVEGLDHGLKLGAADCLQKPITRHELLEALRKVERRADSFD